MVPAVKAFNDGSIDLYYKCRDFCPEAGVQMKEIRKAVRDSLKTVKKYGKLPVKTVIGYHLFVAVPNVYEKLLRHVADMSNVEKYS